MKIRCLSLGFALCALSFDLLLAQWNPPLGQWGKTDARDLRVMTWNVLDTVCSTNAKTEGANNWSAVARIIAAMKPDVLILQECGDNDGNGTGSGVDSVANLLTTAQRLLNGGTDPFHGNSAVTAWVQKYAPGFTYTNIFVSTDNDGFNRDVILSRFPFADQNGDGKSTYSNTPTISPTSWAPGGDGGIRGFQHAEIDLPDASYAGNLVIGNSHLKAGSAGSDHDQRIEAAKNISYYLDAWYNGLGGATPDPSGKIADSPAATAVLAAETSFVWGGDWNEDESSNGTKGPAEWMTRGNAADPGANLNGNDGTDKNRTDASFDDARDVFTNSPFTVTTAKFDYLAWQDSTIALRRAFVFNSATVTPAGAMPAEITGFTGGAASATSKASDHKPVIADFALMAPLGCNSAGIDLGKAKAGTGVRFPRFAACGSLGAGGSATLTLDDAFPFALAYLAYGFGQTNTLALGGTLVPLNANFVGPFATDVGGSTALVIPGGLGAFALYAQWGVVDPGASFGAAFSNALKLQFAP